MVTLFTASTNVSVFLWISEWCTAVLCFMSAVSSFLPVYQFLLSPIVLCATPPDRAGVWSEGQQKTSRLGAIREGHSYSY
jgi:hypothetical protein